MGIAWGRNARFCGKLSVGENVKVVGRMQSRAYQKKQPDGSFLDKIAYEVSVSQIELNKPELQKQRNKRKRCGIIAAGSGNGLPARFA